MDTVLKAFAAFKFREYRLFWVGLFAAQMATQMQIVAVNVQIYDITRSAYSLGIVGLMAFIPVLLFSLIGGIVADKINRKKIMILSQCILVLSSAILAWTTFTHTISPLLIYLGIALYSFVLSFDLPARQAAVPTLVPHEHFMNAVSLSTLGRHSALVIGPMLAGFLIGFFGVKSVYMANMLLFFLSALAISFVAIPNTHMKSETSFSLESVKEGIAFVVHSPMISSTMLLDFIATFFASATVLIPVYAKEILHTGPQGIGMLYAAPSIGSVVAGIIVSGLGTLRNQGKIILLCVLIFGLATIGFGISTSFYLSFFFLAVIGASDVVSTIIRNTLRQVLTPDHMRGRMVSINMIFFTGGPNLGEAEAGFVAGGFGAPFSVISGGVATVLAVVAIAYLFPQLRNYKGTNTAS